jgi:hypothetical protein
MIRHMRNPAGQDVYVMTPADISAAAAWARAICHLALGPEEGERHFRALGAQKIISLWAVTGAEPRAEA